MLDQYFTAPGNLQNNNSLDKKKGRILIIDQDDLTCDFLSSIIKLIGFECEMARTVEQAFEMLQDRVFDLLITDWHLPNTKEFLQRSLEKHPHIQTILMINRRQLFFEAMNLPGTTFVQKPFNFDDIVQKIHQAFHSRNLQQMENQIQRLRHEIFRF